MYLGIGMMDLCIGWQIRTRTIKAKGKAGVEREVDIGAERDDGTQKALEREKALLMEIAGGVVSMAIDLEIVEHTRLISRRVESPKAVARVGTRDGMEKEARAKERLDIL